MYMCPCTTPPVTRVAAAPPRCPMYLSPSLSRSRSLAARAHSLAGNTQHSSDCALFLSLTRSRSFTHARSLSLFLFLSVSTQAHSKRFTHTHAHKQKHKHTISLATHKITLDTQHGPWRQLRRRKDTMPFLLVTVIYVLKPSICMHSHVAILTLSGRV